MKILKLMQYGVLVLALVSLCGAAWLGYYYVAANYYLTRHAYKTVARAVDYADTQLSDRFVAIVRTVQEVSNWLSTHPFDDKVYREVVKKAIDANQDLFGLIIGFVPFAHDKQKRLNSIYYVRQDKSVELRPVTYDYTLSSEKAGARTEWYLDGLKIGSVWSEPFYGTASGQHVVTYAERIYAYTDKQRSTPNGMVAAVVSLDYLRRVINSLELGAAGYGFVVSRRGIYASHPIENYYLKEHSIFDIAKEKHSASLNRIAREITQKDRGAITYRDDISGQEATLLYRRIVGTNFVMAATFLNEELLAPYATQLRRLLMILIVGIVAALSLVVVYVLVTYYANDITVNSALLVLTAILVCGIIAICYVDLRYVKRYEEQNVMSSQHVADKAVQELKTSSLHTEPLIPVKTGILIQSLRYEGNSQIYISALVWQRYPIIESAPLNYDFYMPACERFDQKNILTRYKRGGEETIVWAISGLFNQNHFNSRYYPFDRQDIKVVINYPDVQRNVLLIPDLASYQFISPRLLPGVLQPLNVEGRKLLQSYFSLQHEPSSITLGGQKNHVEGSQHQLRFSIVTDRYLGSILLIYLLPVIVALLFLAGIPFFATKTLGMSLSAISSCAAIFLAMSFSHSAMRKSMIESGGISYLEYYYVFLYALICLIVAYIILFYLARHESLIARRPRPFIILLVAPFYLLLNFIVTAALFL